MRRHLLIGLTALTLVATACGDDATTDTAAQATETTAATTTAPAAETTTTAAAPATTQAPPGVVFTGDDGVESTIVDTSRIVSLSGDLTEILFELGAGDRVVAVDVTTTHPPEAAEIPVIGFGQDLAPEPVLGMQPGLVLANELTGPPETIEQLRAAGIPVVVLEMGTTLDAPVRKIEAIADIVDLEAEGDALAARVQSEIDTALELAAEATTERRAAFVYSRGPQLLLLFGQGMATNAMIEGAGATDVAAETGVFGAQPLTPEALVAAAPDVIVLPSAGFAALGGAEAFLEVPGVAETPAGAEQTFLDYDEAYFFNLGPRAGRALQEFVLDLYPELAGGE